MSTKQFFDAKVEQLEKIAPSKQLDQIFEWVKTGHVGKAMFKELVAYVTLYKEDRRTEDRRAFTQPFEMLAAANEQSESAMFMRTLRRD